MVSPPLRVCTKRKPVRGTLAKYEECIVEVLGAARGQRVMIRSIHPDGIERRTAVKWVNQLRDTGDQRLKTVGRPTVAVTG
ncbi:hypothetical protein B0G84_8110 [Paraburkholderia sp. BL8N3]|nr:hypothetical protein B0G84_8110 [Paraburkholderia sp. BL8N3]